MGQSARLLCPVEGDRPLDLVWSVDGRRIDPRADPRWGGGGIDTWADPRWEGGGIDTWADPRWGEEIDPEWGDSCACAEVIVLN